jgi:hypothetical protein
MDSHIQAFWSDVIHANSHATRNGFMAIESTGSEVNGAVPSNVMYLIRHPRIAVKFLRILPSLGFPSEPEPPLWSSEGCLTVLADRQRRKGMS